MPNRALICGITGQDGSYLAELLLYKGYEVHGLVRKASTFNTGRIDHLYQDPHEPDVRLFLHYGDLSNLEQVTHLIYNIKPDKVYNLAAQSFVPTSWVQPTLTGEFTALGVTRMLEAVRLVDASMRFYQASSSEMYGRVVQVPQNEATPFYPRSPYAVAKLFGHWITVNYREAYSIHASNGILFNHESPIRGETFVTRKITRAVAAIDLGLQDCRYLGNLESRRDWGHARDYVEGMWRMLQQDEADDYVLATGESHDVREFVELAFGEVGRRIAWRGEGIEEKGIDEASGDILVEIDPRYFRPNEVDVLLGDPSKAFEKLGWRHATAFVELVREMVASDLHALGEGKGARAGFTD